MVDLIKIRTEFIDRVKLIAKKAIEFKDSLLSYSYLWKESREERMRQFLVYNHFLTDLEQINLMDSRLAVPELTPSLDNFKDKVKL